MGKVNSRNHLKVTRFSGTLALCSLLSSAAAQAGSLSEKELEEQLATFGDGFIIAKLEAPTIDNPHDWINRRAGKTGSGATKSAGVEVQPDIVVNDLASLAELHRDQMPSKGPRE